MFKKAQYVALAAVILLVIVVLNLPGGVSAQFKRWVGSLFTPLSSLTNTGKKAADKAADLVVSRGELLAQNQSLRKENEELHVRLLQSEQFAVENARLRQLIGWQKQVPWKLKLANVILRDPANWWGTVQIDLGSRDGLREDLPVLTTDGLVGRVSSVSLTHAQVTLIGDPGCKVSARVQNTAHDNGVIVARAGVLDSSLVTLSYLSRNAVVNPGQNVFTSGMGRVFPAGIPIGKIINSQPAEYGLYTDARVKLAANLSSLEHVWVLFP